MAEAKKNPHKNHRFRMYERFSADGFNNYRPHEVLEQLLFESIPRVNTNPIGHELIDRFGSVMNVLDANPDELVKINGIGRKTAEFIVSVKPKISNMIREQYREMGKVTTEMTAFLADWFMKDKNDGAGIVECDDGGVFREWHDFEVVLNEENGFDIENTGNRIISIVGKNKFILVFGRNKKILRSEAYRLLDYSRLYGAVMSDAYVLHGKKPVSLFFMEREKEPKYAPYRKLNF